MRFIRRFYFNILIFYYSFCHFLCCVSSVFGQSLPWYQRTTLYQIYLRSYYDSDGDGIGDIQGILQKLDYIRNLGFETLWLSPFFASPQQDFGYDITDYYTVAPEYGTMQDIEELITQVHRRGMKIILDLVLNHTSIEHPWFQEDLKRSPQERGPLQDFYVWCDQPNNWRSAVRGSAWHYHPVRKQFYYAAFLPFQPDLNYRNPRVQEAMLQVARFWLEKDVDGFRLDLFNYLYEDSSGRHNPFSLNPVRACHRPRFTLNQPETLEFAAELRRLCERYGLKMLLGEIDGPCTTSRLFLGDSITPRLTHAFCFAMLRFRCTARYFEKLVLHMEKIFPSPLGPVYVFSNHDRRRCATRLGGDLRRVRLVHTVQMLARGVPCVYYGEEIGMVDGRLPYKKALDPLPHMVRVPRWLTDVAGETLNRDEVRTPMQWHAGPHAGFSRAAATWLPVNPDFPEKNVEAAMQDSASLLHHFRHLLCVRQPQKAQDVRREGPLLFMGNAVLNFSRRPRTFVHPATGARLRIEGYAVTLL